MSCSIVITVIIIIILVVVVIIINILIVIVMIMIITRSWSFRLGRACARLQKKAGSRRSAAPRRGFEGPEY